MIWVKTTINGQKLDEYMNAEYSPYSVDDLLDADADSDEKEYDRVQEYRFHAPTDLGEKSGDTSCTQCV